MGSGSRLRSIIAPRPCSRRLNAHGAEPRASGGPTARGMAWVTSPHGVKPMGNGHGFPSLVLPPRGGWRRGAGRRVPWGGCRCVPSFPGAVPPFTYTGQIPRKSHTCKKIFSFSLLSKPGQKKPPRARRGGGGGEHHFPARRAARVEGWSISSTSATCAGSMVSRIPGRRRRRRETRLQSV